MSRTLCSCNIPDGEEEAAALEQLRLFGASEDRYTKRVVLSHFHYSQAVTLMQSYCCKGIRLEC